MTPPFGPPRTPESPGPHASLTVFLLHLSLNFLSLYFLRCPSVLLFPDFLWVSMLYDYISRRRRRGEVAAFASFVLQRLHFVTAKGGCELNNKRLPPSGGEPGRSCRGLLPLPEPKGHPVATRPRVAPCNHPRLRRRRGKLCLSRPRPGSYQTQRRLETQPRLASLATPAPPPAPRLVVSCQLLHIS